MILWLTEVLRSCAPLGWVLVAGALAALVGVSTRLAPWALFLGLLVLGVGYEAACFDGRPHLTEKFDATTWVWFKAVQFRALSGILSLALAVPLGRAAGRLAGLRAGGWFGLLMLGIYGLAMLGSSLMVYRAMTNILAQEFPAVVSLENLRHAIHVSSGILRVGSTVTAVGAAVAAALLLRRRAR